MSHIEVKADARALLNDLPNVFVRAADAGMGVPLYLERSDPSSKYDDKSDAFTRILREAAVITRSNPAAGLHASRMSDLLNGTHLDRNGEEIGKERGRALMQIWIMRRWAEAKYQASASTRVSFTSEDDAMGSYFRPYQDNGALRVQDIEVPIPVNELIAMNTPISESSYRTVYLDQVDAKELEYARVPESTEIPVAHLRMREQSVTLHKYGRAIDWTYETARHMRLDKLNLFIRQMALAVEAGKVETIVNVLINGDGNPDTGARVVDVSTLDSTAVNSAITLLAYLQAKKLFKSPLRLSTILARASEITDLEMIPVGNTSQPLVTIPAASGIGGLTLIGDATVSQGVRYGVVENEVADDNYLLFDRNNAIERVYDVGSTVSETSKFITSQTEVMTFTENEGFANLDKDAAILLDMTK